MFTGIAIGALSFFSLTNFLAIAGMIKLHNKTLDAQRTVNLSLMELVDNLHKKIKETERMHMQ